MNSLEVLQSIAAQQGLDGPVPRAMETVVRILGGDFDSIDEQLTQSLQGAPRPVDDIAVHILDAGGKRIRPALCLLSARMCDSAASPPVSLAVVCELLHNATLLHDDVIDEGDIRRGRPAARMVWSNALSILGGDFMLMKCVEIISGLKGDHMRSFVETLKALVNGEIVQLRLREKVDTSVEDYFAIVEGKTASLFGFATSSGARAGGADADDIAAMKVFGAEMGVAFQLIDDVLDFSSSASELGKNLLADIGQGKMTLPVLTAASIDPSVRECLAHLVSGNIEGNWAARVSDIVTNTGSLALVRAKALHHTENAVAALERVGGADPAVACAMRELSFALLERSR